VDSTGLVRGEREGRADIRLEYDGGVAATMQVLITP
jgi:hypothetical protein